MSATRTEHTIIAESGLRNRGPRQQENAEVASNLATLKRPAEEVLIEKLDAFLSSIEHRLARFDQYFKVAGDGFLEDEGVTSAAKCGEIHATTATSHSRSRRSSTASLLSIKEYSMYNLNKVYDQLSSVKDLVLRTLVLNLEYLYKTLDDKYTDLFNADGENTPELSYFDSFSSNRDILAGKIITNLAYFEQKLAHIDALVQSKTPQATANYNADERFQRYRFFNFNRALKAAHLRYLHYYQLPLSWRENRYIIHGYRFSLSHREMWRSMFHFNHNESANIWTHIVGALVMCYLALVHFPQTEVYVRNSRMGNAVMTLFFVAAIECLISSVLWHTYSCFAHFKVRNRFACVDYTGITVLITCSVIAAEYCALYNYAKLLYGFMAVLVASGIGGFLFNWLPYFDRPDCRPLRIGFFVLLAFLGASTFLCKWYYDGLVTAVYFYCPLVYKSFVWYWLGVVFYGGLIPERWRYDIVINEDDTCGHEHSVLEVVTGHVENSGEEELREVVAASMSTDAPKFGSAAAPSSADDDILQHNDILLKHFPETPTRTPYANDFLSLWWVDYILQSHNIWHVFVVLGVVGHYFCLLGMFESIHLQQGLALV